jgi:putative ABC transport system permease protein
MPFFDAVRLALAQIRVQKLKSFFTLLGVTIGVMFLIAVVSIVEGMSSYMEHDFVGKLVGVNTMTLRQQPEIGGDISEAQWRAMQRWPREKITDVQPVVDALPPGTLWSAEGYDNVPIASPYAKPTMLQASAVEGDYFKIREMKVERGRVLSAQEMALGTPVVVIGQEIATRFFPKLDPLGRQLKVAGLPYTVIGVAESQGSIFGLSLDRFVIAPYRSPLRHVVNRPLVIDAMKIKASGDADMTELQEMVRQVMRGRRHLRPSEPDNFTIETSESALSFWANIKSKLVIAGVILPAIGLVVGAIVIMNIMLVAVAERTREIGIRKALGAQKKDIILQFITESIIMTGTSGIIGILLGILAGGIISKLIKIPPTVDWKVIILAFLGSVALGLIFGVYPAKRAADLDPIESLRYE